MKLKILSVFVLLFGFHSATALAQAPNISCRPLNSGNTFVEADEKIIGDQACKVVNTPSAPQTAANQPVSATSAPLPAQQQAASVPNHTAKEENLNPTATTTSDPPPAPRKQNLQGASKPCVILKRMGPADEVTSHLYSFGIRGKQFQFVEGTLPPGASFHGRLTDHDVRAIESKGGKVIVIEPKYSVEQLDYARKECEE